MKIKNFEDGNRKAEQVISESFSYLEMWSNRKQITIATKVEELTQAEVVDLMDKYSI